MAICITGFGYAYPGDGLVPAAQILTNEMIAQARGGTDEEIAQRTERIFEQTGIRQRPILDTTWGGTNRLAAVAAKRAIEASGSGAELIDAVVLATMTPDMQSPQAYGLATELGLGNVPVFPVEAACSGFIYALELARGLLRIKGYRRILVIGSDVMSRVVDPATDSRLIFGDGAGAFILEKRRSGMLSPFIINVKLGSDDGGRDKIKVPAGGCFQMKGVSVYRWALGEVSLKLAQFLKAQRVDPDRIERVVAHQANINILQGLAERTHIPWENWVTTLETKANCSAGTIPLALALNASTFRSGENILLAGFGGGLTWGFALIRWMK